LDAVLTRIQAAKAEPSFVADSGADIAVRGATSAMLRKVASVSLGVVCIAAASVAFVRLNRHTSEPARSAKSAPTAVASAPSQPPPKPMAIAMQPALVPSVEPSTSAQTSAAPDEAQAAPRSQRRRSRAIAERQRASRIEMASVPEPSSSAPHDTSTNVTVPQNSAAPHERAEPGNSVKAAAAIQEAAPRATSFQSNAQEAVTAARKADPTLPQPARTELALLKRIQGALREADFSAVLALCAEHARRWPHGVFELEREGARAIAACGGNSDDAVRRAQRFLTAHPHAPVAMRVRAACAVQLTKR
jgi:hypothetical protein